MSQMVLKGVTCGWWCSLGPWLWPVTVVYRVPKVMFQLGELKVHVWVHGQHLEVWWKLVQTGVSSLPLGDESSELGLTDDSLDGNDAGGEYEGDPGEWHLGGDNAGDTGECLNVSLGHQTSWTGCPYSLLHCWCSSLCCGKTRFWPGWPDGLERNCLWAIFPPFSTGCVLKGGAIVTYGFQMSLIPSVDSAVGALDHVRSSTF